MRPVTDLAGSADLLLSIYITRSDFLLFIKEHSRDNSIVFYWPYMKCTRSFLLLSLPEQSRYLYHITSFLESPFTTEIEAREGEIIRLRSREEWSHSTEWNGNLKWRGDVLLFGCRLRGSVLTIGLLTSSLVAWLDSTNNQCAASNFNIRWWGSLMSLPLLLFLTYDLVNTSKTRSGK